MEPNNKIYLKDWEVIDQGQYVKSFARLKVPGGWLIRIEHGTEITFLPDKDHEWVFKV